MSNHRQLRAARVGECCSWIYTQVFRVSFFFYVLFFFFYQSFIEASDLGTPAPSRRLLSLLILPGRGEVVVLETTDGVADGK